MELALNPALITSQPGAVRPQQCVFTKRTHFLKATVPESTAYPVQNVGSIPRRSGRKAGGVEQAGGHIEIRSRGPHTYGGVQRGRAVADSTASNHDHQAQRETRIADVAPRVRRQTCGSPVTVPLPRRRTERSKAFGRHPRTAQGETDRCGASPRCPMVRRLHCGPNTAGFALWRTAGAAHRSRDLAHRRRRRGSDDSVRSIAPKPPMEIPAIARFVRPLAIGNLASTSEIRSWTM